MTILSTYVLVGIIISTDPFLSTVEFNLNPAVNGGPSIAILPNEAIPCKVTIGQKIYVVKHENQKLPVITCEDQ
jgi:hypothetical protein